MCVCIHSIITESMTKVNVISVNMIARIAIATVYK